MYSVYDPLRGRFPPCAIPSVSVCICQLTRIQDCRTAETTNTELLRLWQLETTWTGAVETASAAETTSVGETAEILESLWFDDNSYILEVFLFLPQEQLLGKRHEEEFRIQNGRGVDCV